MAAKTKVSKKKSTAKKKTQKKAVRKKKTGKLAPRKKQRGLRQITALVSPDEELAYRILALVAAMSGGEG
ncbi:hypothetical protein [Thiohalophilus sp.]|uniref:hypothetical protein n=1 Tax=Thiohalophilus sp. TaxID=3028392 RepID=UPI002ACD6AFF|nr:hypothetical protein [Thiohalophilus sp.]MDZ7662092.1 hypothetical protein [Thiohalophilus sp.]